MNIKLSKSTTCMMNILGNLMKLEVMTAAITVKDWGCRTNSEDSCTLGLGILSTHSS